MIVYRDVIRTATTDECLRSLRRLAGEGRAADFLVEVGRLEQGAADARHPARDDFGPVDAVLRSATLAAGRAYIAPTAEGRRRPMAEALALLGEVRPALPPALEIRDPEGYAHYALDPRAYGRSAAAYRRDAGERAPLAVVVGIRSIGTSLSGVVAAAVSAGTSVTVRPHGESGHRRIDASERVTDRIVDAVASGGDVLVVDEGPGVTGETFECTARWLRQSGVPETRIVLFPSHDGAMPLAPEGRRAWFRRSRRYLPRLDDDRLARIASARSWPPPLDLSRGAWRRRVFGAADLPAAPHFERLKARVQEEGGPSWMVRYAGLGASLDRWLERAAALSDGKAGPTEMAGLGFVTRPWVEGTPFRRGVGQDPVLANAMAGYIAVRAGRFRTGQPADAAWWANLLLENGVEAGLQRQELGRAARALELLPEREATIPDGRLQPWEWIRTGAGGTVKIDTVDHGDGLRLPGPADPAWDVAGATIELELTPAAAEHFRQAVRSAAGGPPAGRAAAAADAGAVAAYRPVYAAACYGDSALAAREATDPTDGSRLRAEARFYAAALRSSVNVQATFGSGRA